jgi:hypothetical protein
MKIESAGPLFDAPLYQAHSETSRAAAHEIAMSVATLRMRVYELIASSPEGVTDEYGQITLGMEGNTYRPRRRELQQAGAIKDSGTKRKTSSGRNAVVWVRA